MTDGDGAATAPATPAIEVGEFAAIVVATFGGAGAVGLSEQLTRASSRKTGASRVALLQKSLKLPCRTEFGS